MRHSAEPADEANAVQAFYASNAEVQWTRFDRFARIEEYVLRKALAENLPAPPALVADIGGGNGRHAFHLAQLGYRVRLCDLTQKLVADARRRNTTAASHLDSVDCCDARELPWPDACADAVLLLGPMYCLADRGDRIAVLREARRVLRPEAPLFAQLLSRVAALRSLLEAAPGAGGIFDWQDFLRTGIFRSERMPDFFRIHYFSTPAEARRELADAGLEPGLVRGMDGPASSFGQRKLADAPDHIIRQWGEIAYALGEAADYRSTATHLLAVARRPAAVGDHAVRA
jgi:SAM-dependent methyltransferase